MKTVKQTIVDKGNGDCFRACICSLLNIPNCKEVPNPHDDEWWFKWERFFASFGMRIMFDTKKIWREGYWIASVQSLNFKGVSHAIIMKGCKVFFDPSPKQKYAKGRDLFIESHLVNGGYWIEINDIGKLNKLLDLQKALNAKYS